MAMFMGTEICVDLAAQAAEMSFAAWWVSVGEGATRGAWEEEDGEDEGAMSSDCISAPCSECIIQEVKCLTTVVETSLAALGGRLGIA